MNKVLVLGLGIVIGAGGMWFMQKSSEKTLQVDEVIESYSTPATTNGTQTTPPATNNQGMGTGTGDHAPATTPGSTTTGSTAAPLNLSDATNTMDGTMESGMDGMNNDMNNPNKLGNNNPQNPTNNGMDMGNTMNSNNNMGGSATPATPSNTTTPSQGGY